MRAAAAPGGLTMRVAAPKGLTMRVAAAPRGTHREGGGGLPGLLPLLVLLPAHEVDGASRVSRRYHSALCKPHNTRTTQEKGLTPQEAPDQA